jgi:peptidoglycan/LPS O-acetylase OafA/YrhL
VRAFAALWVVLHHLRPAPAGLERAFEAGYLGVDLFGFLSGFVIAHHYAAGLGRPDARRVGRFLWLRVARIFPLHWLALAAMLAAWLAIPGFGTRPEEQGRFGAADFALAAAMLHGWGFGNRLAWNVPSWTVSTEWLCYLLFPLAAPAVARVRSGPLAAALAAASLLAAIALLHAVGRPSFFATTDWGWIRIGGEFLAGCFLQRAWSAGWARRAPWGALGLVGVAGAAACVAIGHAAGTVVCFAVLVYALAHERGPLARLLAARPLVFLGEASYAIYILHWVVLRARAYGLPHPLAATPWAGSRTAVVALDLALALAVAVAIHVALENPARRHLRLWFSPAGKGPRGPWRGA